MTTLINSDDFFFSCPRPFSNVRGRARWGSTGILPVCTTPVGCYKTPPSLGRCPTIWRFGRSYWPPSVLYFHIVVRRVRNLANMERKSTSLQQLQARASHGRVSGAGGRTPSIGERCVKYRPVKRPSFSTSDGRCRVHVYTSARRPLIATAGAQ